MKRYLDERSPNKTKYELELFKQLFSDAPTWKDIKHIDFQDDDIIFTSYEEEYDSYYVSIVRWVDETDEEYKKRLENNEKRKEDARAFRYKSYLALKKEFEIEDEV